MKCKGVIKGNKPCQNEAIFGDLCERCYRKSVPKDKAWEEFKRQRSFHNLV